MKGCLNRKGFAREAALLCYADYFFRSSGNSLNIQRMDIIPASQTINSNLSPNMSCLERWIFCPSGLETVLVILSSG